MMKEIFARGPISCGIDAEPILKYVLLPAARRFIGRFLVGVLALGFGRIVLGGGFVVDGVPHKFTR